MTLSTKITKTPLQDLSVVVGACFIASILLTYWLASYAPEFLLVP